MTKRDYFNVAYAMRNANPRESGRRDIESESYYESMVQWELTVDTLVGTFRTYANFKADLFRAACGYTVRPDGSMWTVDWATNRIPNFRNV